MIKDLFSHKIHSSGDDWPDKLVELAGIFSQFDGHVYDRRAIEERLSQISPRAAYAPRDVSKFRDEISAYPAYLGLYHLLPSPEGWRVRLSRTARTLLVREEPDVASFMRLQMALFQYPNGMGIAYRTGTNNVRIQANARDRMLSFIAEGIHLNPLRLVIAGILADASMGEVPDLEGAITFEEVFAIANDARTNREASPPLNSVTDVLTEFRNGRIPRPTAFERRFHILKHTDLFEIGKGKICLRTPASEADKVDLAKKVNAIQGLSSQFTDFDAASDGQEIERVVCTGAWAHYFDAMATLSADAVDVLARDIICEPETTPEPCVPPSEVETVPGTFELTERQGYSVSTVAAGRKRELADPETTRIKRQKRNLAHKLLIDRMYDYLARLGAVPKDNPHIDLYAEIPNDGSFLFEMKSGGDNFLDQIRKGISQLYEYRFRYKAGIRDDTVLCLVIPSQPHSIPWLCEYLCVDRRISLCWFSEDGRLTYPEECADSLRELTAA